MIKEEKRPLQLEAKQSLKFHTEQSLYKANMFFYVL